jgi:hypothetical protein
MIDFENSKISTPGRLAVRKRVEPGSEYHELAHTSARSFG